MKQLRQETKLKNQEKQIERIRVLGIYFLFNLGFRDRREPWEGEARVEQWDSLLF